jgi:hypothetical protein
MWLPTIDSDDTALGVALKYAAAGWRVVPAARGSHDTNSIVEDAETSATRDPHQITEWFAGTNHTVMAVCDVGETYFLPEAMVNKSLSRRRLRSARGRVLGPLCRADTPLCRLHRQGRNMTSPRRPRRHHRQPV